MKQVVKPPNRSPQTRDHSHRSIRLVVRSPSVVMGSPREAWRHGQSTAYRLPSQTLEWAAGRGYRPLRRKSPRRSPIRPQHRLFLSLDLTPPVSESPSSPCYISKRRGSHDVPRPETCPGKTTLRSTRVADNGSVASSADAGLFQSPCRLERSRSHGRRFACEAVSDNRE